MEPNQTSRWHQWADTVVPFAPGWHLRTLTETDVPDLVNSIDDHVRHGLLMDRSYGPAEASQLVTHTAPRLASHGRGAVWGIAQEGGTDSRSRIQGVLTLHAEGSDQARIGFWLARATRGQGLAAAAVRAIARETLGAGGLAGLIWVAPVGNVDSLRVARSAGFEPTGTSAWSAGSARSMLPSWHGQLMQDTAPAERLWADCLVEIAAGAWQLQPMDAASAAVAEEVLPVSACLPTGVWAAKEITTARVDAVVALLTRHDRAWVVASPATDQPHAHQAAVAAAEVVDRYARRALGLITP